MCNKFARNNQRTELLNHNIPDFAFDKVGVDIAHHGGKDYLIVVDYFSRWVEVSKLKWKNSKISEKKIDNLPILTTLYTLCTLPRLAGGPGMREDPRNSICGPQGNGY